MEKYLLFNLYGAMSSWGSIAVGETRPTDRYPSKSAVIGLMAAALGIRRCEEKKLLSLQQNLGFAVRLNSQAELIDDFHTAQVPIQRALKKQPHFSRKDELQAQDLRTVLSNRQYCCDAFYTIILWHRSNQAELEKIADKLQHPTFTLYLGRKSCPLSLPIHPYFCTETNIESALEKYDKTSAAQYTNKLLKTLLTENDSLYTDLDGKVHSAKHSHQIIRRNDHLINRKRWQYSERKEQYINIKLNQLGE